MTLNGDDGDADDINFSPASVMPAPYLHYGADGDEGGGAGAGGRGGADKQDKPKKPKAGGRERPRSAARRDDGESKSSRK